MLWLQTNQIHQKSKIAMCLATIHKTAKIATRDIVCYKVCRNTEYEEEVITPYQNVQMGLGVMLIDPKELSITLSLDYYYIITAGVFHSLKNLKDAEIELSEWEKCFESTYCIVKCIIPKGSEYFPGTFWTGFKYYESYGSKQIKLIEKIK